MSLVYLKNAPLTLDAESNHFLLRSPEKLLARIPPNLVDTLIAEHEVSITEAAFRLMSQAKISMTRLDGRGRLAFRLQPPLKHDAHPRLAQAAAWFDLKVRLRLAQRWVDAKLANGLIILRRHLSNHSSPVVSDSAKAIKRIRDQILHAEDIPTLMGHEGHAAHHYFQALGRMLRVEWTTFHTRIRQPPRDPVNATLSYLYAILVHSLHTRIEAHGLDPYIGYLHRTEARRPNLALDLVEPFRPALADRCMLRLLNLGTLKESHFKRDEASPQAIFLSDEARQLLVSTLHHWMTQDASDETESFEGATSLLDQEVRRFHQAARSAEGLLNFQPYLLDEAERRLA